MEQKNITKEEQEKIVSKLLKRDLFMFIVINGLLICTVVGLWFYDKSTGALTNFIQSINVKF